MRLASWPSPSIAWPSVWNTRRYIRDDLDRANQELESLNARLITAQEEERRRLARELHDDLTQRIAAVAITAGTLNKIAEPGSAKWRQGLEDIQRQLVDISNYVPIACRGVCIRRRSTTSA